MAMLCALIVSAGTLLLSAVLGVVVVVVLGVFSTVIAAPAALVLLGPRVRRYRRGGRAAPVGGGAWGRFAERSLRRPMVLEAIVAAGLLALAELAHRTGSHAEARALLEEADAVAVGSSAHGIRRWITAARAELDQPG